MNEFSEYIVGNVYKLIDEKTSIGYTIVFGNLYWGYHIPEDKKSLKRLWSICIHLSKAKYYGDITLFYNCKLIRSINNANVPIRMKPHNDPNRFDIYPYSCNKYKYK